MSEVEHIDLNSRKISRRSLIAGGVAGLISAGILGKVSYDVGYKSGKKDLREQILAQYSPVSTALVSGEPESSDFYHISATSSVIDINPFILRYELKIDPRSKPFQILAPDMFPSGVNYGVIWESLTKARWIMIHEGRTRYLQRIHLPEELELSAAHPSYIEEIIASRVRLDDSGLLQVVQGKDVINAATALAYIPS